MRVSRYTQFVAGLAIVLAATAGRDAAAQTDTTRRVTSETRIPVRKGARIVQESSGEVALAAEVARINALEETAATLRQRLELKEAELASLTSRADANAASVKSLEAALQLMREELFGVRYSLALATARATALEERVAQFDRRMYSLKHGSLFGHSGFYIGLGAGMNFPTGTLHNVGYGAGLNVVMPIGWNKPGQLLGVRAELAAQTLEGNVFPGFRNVDPVAWSGNAMLTVNLPINKARTNLFYLMGGGGVFVFDRVGATSALSDRLADTGGTAKKFGLMGGAGLEFHILGATSLFVESAFTNVFGERPVTTAGDNRNLRWVPLVAGITLR
jgi:opacity protein-like surface antigen